MVVANGGRVCRWLLWHCINATRQVHATKFVIIGVSYSITKLLRTKSGRSGSDLQEQHVTFPAGFPIALACGKPVGKVANGDQVT